jgi:hypothetical protein
MVYFVVIWHIYFHFGVLHQGKSGSPESELFWNKIYLTGEGESLSDIFRRERLRLQSKTDGY